MPVLGPVLADRNLQFATVFFYFVFQNAYMGTINAAMQGMTPKLFLVNMVGLGVGTALAGLAHRQS